MKENKFNKILKENQKKINEKRSRALEMQRKRIKKEQRIDKILIIFIAIYIILTTLLNIILLFTK